MQKFTRTKLNALYQAMQDQYEIDNVAEEFSVSPARAQTIIEAAKQQSSFLSKINVITVKPQTGEAISVNATGMIASRTNTDNNDREPRDPHVLGGTPYHCDNIDFDTFIKHQTLDAWAHKANFQELVAKQTRKQINSNMIMIGFWGETKASDSDPVANPKGQDLAIGWFKKLEDQALENIMVEAVESSGEIKIGEGGDFANLDVAVNAVKSMIEPEFEDDGDLVVIIGSQLLSMEKDKFYNDHGNTPSEKGKIEDQQVIGTYGGLPAFKVPHFPNRGILVTSFDNLSIYIQEDSIRRTVIDNVKRRRLETYQSQNMDYVIEELGKAAAVKHSHVKLKNTAGNWV